jgi:HAD superfamily hydrolase (TIGR01450 family)
MEIDQIDQLKYFFFDLDKTVWNWNDTIIGSEDLIKSIRDSSKQVYFHTDNTLLSREGYAKKLTSMGIPAEETDVITSGYVAARYLAKRDINNVYVIGETGLTDELEKQEINIREEADVVVAGFDRQFNYNKLKRAAKILENGGELVLCSTEKTFRTAQNSFPHQGPTNLALRQFADDITLVGKPSEIFQDEFRDYFSFLPTASAFIGDRLEDVELGNRLGMTTAAVMSGEINRDKLAEAKDIQKPDFGLSSLTRLRKHVL